MAETRRRQIILASQSPQRRRILETLKINFEIKPAGIDEQSITASTQADRAEQVARAKAEAVSDQHPQAIVIAGDTYGLHQGQVLEKPKTNQEAEKMLSVLSGQEMTALTGFCYLDPQKEIDVSLTKKVWVKFRPLTSGQIHNYVQTEPVLTWSAAFSAAYDSGIALIAEIKGSLTAFTHGLPLEEVARCLGQSQLLNLSPDS